MAIKKGGGSVVQEGVVLITAEDNTQAGVKSAEASVNKGLKSIEKGAASATKPFGAIGAAASRAGSQASSAFSQAGQGLSSFASGVGKVPPALGAVTSGLGRLAPAAAGVIGALTAGVALFDAWAESSDQARKATVSMQVSIEGAREAFGGMVSDLDLARSANKAFALGVVQNGVEFAALSRGVSAIARNLGEDNLQLMDNAVTAIGRGSALILDNLGIIMTQEKAERMYAASLGVTVKELTALNKAEAFGKAAMQEIAEAGKKAGASVDGLANSYMKAKVSAENFKNGIIGVNTRVGNVRETMRKMAPEVLDLFGSRAQTDIGTINRELMRQAQIQAKQAQDLGDTNAKASDFLLTYEEVLAVADELGNVEVMRSGLVDYDNRKKRETELNRLAKEALGYQQQIIEKSNAQAAQAEKADKVKTLGEEAATLEHQAKLLGFQKNTEGEILMLQVQALEKRGEAAKLTNDQNAALQAQRDIELLLAAPLEKKKGGGGSGPTEADRVKAAGEARVQYLQSEVQYAEVIGKIRGTTDADALEVGKMKLAAADAELALERDALAVTRAKNSVDRTNIDNRITAIDRERELLGLQRQADERAAANDLVAKAIEQQSIAAALRSEQARQESEHLGNVISLEQARLAQQEQRIRAAGVADKAAAMSTLGRLDAEAQTEAALHAVKLRQLEEEHAAKVRTLNLREDTTRDKAATSPLEREQQLGELRQIEHDKQLERMSFELAMAREKDAEEARISASSRARMLEQISMAESVIGSVSQLYGQASEFASFLGQQRAADADAALSSTVKALEARGRAQQASLEVELKANAGNTVKLAEIKRKAAKNEQALQAKIEQAKEAHAEKQRKIESRAAGIKLLIDGAVNTAKAVSSYASYNFVQGALYTAAAAFNFVQGGMLLAGNVPGASSGGGAGLGGGAGSGGGGTDRDTSAASSTPGSIPGEAARRSTSATAGATNQGGVVIVINGGVNANGAIDDEFGEKMARKLRDISQTREAG